jgi:hypothetical protein
MGNGSLTDYGNPVLAVLAVGLSCGTACSPLVNLFLTSYTMSGFIGFGRGLGAFGCFVLGKTMVITILAVVSAIIGSAALGENSKVFGFSLKIIADLCMILTGVILLIKQKRRLKNQTGCAGCIGAGQRRSCGAPPQRTAKLPLVIMGAACGLTPCAPMLLVLGYACLLTPLAALRLGLVFSIAGSISPMLLLTACAGFFARKMYLEIPQLVGKWQQNIFIFLIVAGGISLFLHW